MKWTPENKEKALLDIFKHIEDGKSVRSLLDKADRNILPSNRIFLEWVAEDEELGKRYARARELREELIFEEILNIADSQENDIIETENGSVVNHNVINRNRLQIDARKWMLGKMNSSKYGDKVQQEHSGEIKTNFSTMSTEELIKRAEATSKLQ